MKRPRLMRRWSGDASSAFPWVIVFALAAVAAGFAVGQGTRPESLTGASWYLPAAGALLAVGLYGSTHRIDPAGIRRDLRTIVIAVTLGVLLKAALIAATMVAVFRRPEYLVLGIAVAQIDPLSVAAMNSSRRMSERAKTLLAAWASFDDPMTVLLSLHFSVLAFHLSGRTGPPSLAPQGNGMAAYAAGIGLNLLLFGAVVAAWYLPRLLWRGYAARRARGRSAAPVTVRPSPRLADALALALVTALVAVAADAMLMLAVALAGLVVRTGRYQTLVDRLVTVAFLGASFGLGMLLVDGAALVTGAVLGVTAFLAQAVIALLVAPRLLSGLALTDRIHLGLGQQNGITAIILALALEPDFPGTVGTIGPAILTVNLLHYGSNGVWERWLRTRRVAEPVPSADTGGSAGAGGSAAHEPVPCAGPAAGPSAHPRDKPVCTGRNETATGPALPEPGDG